jgi:signal transduction histidine kinase
MSSGISPEDVRSLLEDASWGAHRMADIVDNLLELSRWQAKRLMLATSPLDIGAAVRGAVQRINPRLTAHTVVMDIEANLPKISADSIRIERVLDNLLENAVKYSPNGGRIRVSAKAADHAVIVSVEDQGIGIPVKDQANLFQPFRRLENATDRALQGIGLGLVVCRRLVEPMAAASGSNQSSTAAPHSASRCRYRDSAVAPSGRQGRRPSGTQALP